MKKVYQFINFSFLILFITFLFFCGKHHKIDSLKNIEAFCRLYGYVKYFYPGDEAAKIDWNKFAIYGVKKVENAKDSAELKQILEEIFLPIAPALSIFKQGQDSGFSNSFITPPNKNDMKIISWQHLGVGLGSSESVYKSIRLNRKNTLHDEMNYGTISSSLDAIPFRNKEFKFKAAVKVNEGKGYLWLRIDTENKGIGFFDNMSDRPVQTNEWKDYEITGVVDRDAVQIYFGGLLSGTGKVWVDNFHFFIRNQDIWEPVALQNPDFEEDLEGKSPTGWDALNPSYKIQITSETAEKGKKSISIESEIQYFSGELFKKKASFGETVSKEIGSGLSCIFPLALYGTEDNTYPQVQIKDFNFLTSEIEKEVPNELSGNDRYVRLGDVVITWNIFQHFYPYFDIVGTDWNAALKETLKLASKDKTEKEFLFTMKKFIAKLKDGHGRVGIAGQSRKEFLLPLVCEWIEEQPVIVRILDKNISNIQVGDILREIAGENSISKLEKAKQYISAATDGWLMFRALDEILITPNELDTKIKVEREDGNIIESTIKPVSRLIYYRSSYNSESSMPKKLKDGVYYIDISNVPMDKINSEMSELIKAKAILCDLRGYPKSNHDFISHLLKEKDTSTAWIKIPQIIYPDFENVTYRDRGWEIEPMKPYLPAKIVFIIDGQAISYAESYMSFIEHYKLATIVGQPTAGTNGNINPFQLPGGYYVSWTGMKVVKHDGSQHHGIGIIPNVRVERTIKGVREGRDEYLEKALELIGN